MNKLFILFCVFFIRLTALTPQASQISPTYIDPNNTTDVVLKIKNELIATKAIIEAINTEVKPLDKTFLQPDITKEICYALGSIAAGAVLLTCLSRLFIVDARETRLSTLLKVSASVSIPGTLIYMMAKLIIDKQNQIEPSQKDRIEAINSIDRLLELINERVEEQKNVA
jgi:hypothetical protein